MNDFRDIAKDVLARIDHMFRYSTALDVQVTSWDYRLEPPAVVPAGGLSGLSVLHVERSHAGIVIWGEQLPPITTKEIRKAFEMRRDGHEMTGPWVFQKDGLKQAHHDAFRKTLVADFGEDISYATFLNELDFQARVFTTLIPYLLDKATGGAAPLIGTTR